MTVTQLGVVGWLAGLLAYLAALALVYGQWISGGDLRFVIFTSLVAFGACYLLLYVPVLSLVRRFLPRSTLIWISSLCCSASFRRLSSHVSGVAPSARC